MASHTQRNETMIRKLAKREENKHCVDCTGSGGMVRAPALMPPLWGPRALTRGLGLHRLCIFRCRST